MANDIEYLSVKRHCDANPFYIYRNAYVSLREEQYVIGYGENWLYCPQYDRLFFRPVFGEDVPASWFVFPSIEPALQTILSLPPAERILTINKGNLANII